MLTSHNLSEVEEICNRVAIIANGKIRALNAPQNLRRQTKQTQRVKISLTGISENVLREKLFSKLRDFTIESFAEIVSVNFEREPDDDALGETISLLAETGAKIRDVETESPTLLDVLESYE